MTVGTDLKAVFMQSAGLNHIKVRVDPRCNVDSSGRAYHVRVCSLARLEGPMMRRTSARGDFLARSIRGAKYKIGLV